MIHTLNFNSYIQKHRLSQICIDSWKKEFPNEEIKVWDENNIDQDFINIPYFKHYINYKAGPACDSLKCQIINKYGGTFLDPDIQVLPGLKKALDKLNINAEFNLNNFFNDGSHALSNLNRYNIGSSIISNICAAYRNQKEYFEESDYAIALVKNVVKTKQDIIEDDNIRSNSALLFNSGIDRYYTHWNLHAYFFADSVIKYFNFPVSKIFIIPSISAYYKTLQYINEHKHEKYFVYYSLLQYGDLPLNDGQEILFPRGHNFINLELLNLYFSDVVKRENKLKDIIVDWDNVLVY